MQFLHDTTLAEVANKKIGIILRSNAEILDTISAHTFLSEDRLFIDCIPEFHRKYVVAVPGDAIVSRALTPSPPWEFAIFIHPNSEAGRFVKSLLEAKIISHN